MFDLGTYKKLYLKVSGATEFMLVGHLTSNSFTENTETLSSTTRDNAGWNTQVLLNQGYSIPFAGVIPSQSEAGKLFYNDIKTAKRNRELIEWKIENDLGGDYDYGYGQIIQLADEANVDEFMTFTGNIIGYGEPVIGNGNLYVMAGYVDSEYVD